MAGKIYVVGLGPGGPDQITPRGEAAFAGIRGLFARWDGEAAQGLSPGEARELRRLLGKLVKSKELSFQDRKEVTS